MQVKYENGRIAQVGDAGLFADATDGQGYLYEGAVTAINEHGRLTIEGPIPTLIMADCVRLYRPAGDDQTLALEVRKYSRNDDAKRHEELREMYQRWLVTSNGTFLDFVLVAAATDGPVVV